MTIFNGHRLIPTVTVQSPDEADVLVKILLKAQLPIVELTLRQGFSVEAVNTLLDNENIFSGIGTITNSCLLYTSPSPRDKRQSRMPSSA